MIKPIVWENDSVTELIATQGKQFARLRSPHGWRKSARELLLPPTRKRLEGNCFLIAMKLSFVLNDTVFYCEGYAEGLPHAWVSPRYIHGENADADWCIDITWPYFMMRNGRRVWDSFEYSGVRFLPEEVRNFFLERNKKYGEGTSSLSMMKYHQEVKHLIR
jgi:hypothetical protein